LFAEGSLIILVSVAPTPTSLLDGGEFLQQLRIVHIKQINTPTENSTINAIPPPLKLFESQDDPSLERLYPEEQVLHELESAQASQLAKQA